MSINPTTLDKRPYIFSFMNDSNWGFIALNTEYESNMTPLERWVINDSGDNDNDAHEQNTTTSYGFFRAIYTKEDASNHVKRASINSMQDIIFQKGPDIYHVVDLKTNTTIITVWKPSIKNEMELLYKHDICDKIPDSATPEEIKARIFKIMNLNALYVKIIPTKQSTNPALRSHLLKL